MKGNSLPGRCERSSSLRSSDLAGRWIGFAELFDGDPLGLIYLDELEAIVKAAPVANRRAYFEGGRQFNIDRFAGREMLRQNHVQPSLAQDKTAAPQRQG